MTDAANHLTGPWRAVIYDENRSAAYLDYSTAASSAHFADDGFIVAIVRDSAMPEGEGPAFKPPAAFFDVDLAHEIECALHDPVHEELSLERRWEQARAMAAGLNAAGGES